MKTALSLLIFGLALAASAGTPQLRPLKATWATYVAPSDASNVVIVIYKSTSLGTVWSPFKPTAMTSANRTNLNFSALPGMYRFYATVQASNYPESVPSLTVTNRVQ